MLAVLGDSVTTDHISPAGSIRPSSPAGVYLTEHGVEPSEFNSYGARRGNHEVMMRGTFANVRLRNLLAPGTEGGVTRLLPGGEQMSIYDAAMRYRAEGIPLVVLAGERVRVRLVTRLGGQGPGPPRRAGRHRRELRADPPLEPVGHGDPAPAVHRRHVDGEPRPDRGGDLRHRRARRAARRRRAQGDRGAGRRRRVQRAGPHRHAHGGGVLPPRRASWRTSCASSPAETAPHRNTAPTPPDGPDRPAVRGAPTVAAAAVVGSSWPWSWPRCPAWRLRRCILGRLPPWTLPSTTWMRLTPT